MCPLAPCKCLVPVCGYEGPPGEPKGTTDAVKVEMEVTSSKDPGDVDVQELTFLTVPPKLLAGAKLVSLHIQIDKLTS